jgi:CHRD domain-containing protein
MRTAKLLGLTLLASASLAASLAMARTAAVGGRPFTVQMTGAAERPGPGDADGSGTAKLTLNHGQGRVCYEITVSNIAEPTMAHIHKAGVNSPGPIVVPLFVTTGTTMKGCVAADRDLIKDIIQRPGDYYTNVHNAEFPPGAIRGQMAKK